MDNLSELASKKVTATSINLKWILNRFRYNLHSSNYLIIIFLFSLKHVKKTNYLSFKKQQRGKLLQLIEIRDKGNRPEKDTIEISFRLILFNTKNNSYFVHKRTPKESLLSISLTEENIKPSNDICGIVILVYQDLGKYF